MSLLNRILFCTFILAWYNQRCLSKDPEELRYCYLHSLLGRQMGTCGYQLDRAVKDICDARDRGLPHEFIYELYNKRSQKRSPQMKKETRTRPWEIPKKSALDFLRPQESKRLGKIAEYEDGDLQISLWDAGNQTIMLMDMDSERGLPSLERGIICECCVHHCSINEMLEYCH